ncbi:helix-turn-helix domain-containing protein [Actinophytocola sp.]|uniref:helix-turn-helix domain-containing protein n=1 Tax=Actinophytocola sp. TaxID=1872138 RepID=UPI003899FC72
MISAKPNLGDVLAQLARVLVEQTATPPMPPTQPASERILLTVEEAAERLGIGRTFAWRLVRTGELKSVQIGRLRRVHVDAVRDYTERLITKGAA